MTFKQRIVLSTAAAVAISIVLASAIVYVVVRSNMHEDVDSSLKRMVGDVATVPAPGPGFAMQVKKTAPADEQAASTKKAKSNDQHRAVLIKGSTPLGGSVAYAQVIDSSGDVLRSQREGPQLPISNETLSVGAGVKSTFIEDRTVDGFHIRVLTAKGPDGSTIQVARSLAETDNSLHNLLGVLVAISLIGVAAAAALGLVVARTALAPVKRLTGTAERVAETDDLSLRLDVHEDGDELDRLAIRFNEMLSALERSRAAQHQLVADASHELRTPLTSIRANVESLARDPQLSPRDREMAVASTIAQIEDLSALVDDLVDVARPDDEVEQGEELRLDMLVSDEVERARRRDAQTVFRLQAQPASVVAAPARLDRAISNLLDNATKHGPSSGPVDVTLVADEATGRAELTVDDAGPGIPERDRARVFERFWRAPEARGLAGSGLGLSIVKQVAEQHGGGVSAGDAPGGGARLTLWLPLSGNS